MAKNSSLLWFQPLQYFSWVRETSVITLKTSLRQTTVSRSQNFSLFSLSLKQIPCEIQSYSSTFWGHQDTKSFTKEPVHASSTQSVSFVFHGYVVGERWPGSVLDWWKKNTSLERGVLSLATGKSSGKNPCTISFTFKDAFSSTYRNTSSLSPTNK